MKPTWAGWAEVYAAQQVDVSSTEECLYAGRWNEHDDVAWSDWVITDTQLPWNHCVSTQQEDINMNIELYHTVGSRLLWQEIDPQTQDTIWYPVQYPN